MLYYTIYIIIYIYIVTVASLHVASATEGLIPINTNVFVHLSSPQHQRAGPLRQPDGPSARITLNAKRGFREVHNHGP